MTPKSKTLELILLGKKLVWTKHGRFYQGGTKGFTHASHPCLTNIDQNDFLLAHTERDSSGKSHIFLSRVEISDGVVSFKTSPKMVLSPGPTGYFDCDGVISTTFVRTETDLYLFYVGWQNLPNGMWICETGRIRVDTEKLTVEREFDGPIMSRNRKNPLFVAATAVTYQDGAWNAWYNSGLEWKNQANGSYRHRYGIFFGESVNGIEWNYSDQLCVPFLNDNEYAFGRPSIILLDGVYVMFYAHRATAVSEKYRIGLSFSFNKIDWVRRDEMSGIDTSNDSWENEMVCYPYIFRHQNFLYLFYNGNAYGKTGFGFAHREI